MARERRLMTDDVPVRIGLGRGGASSMLLILGLVGQVLAVSAGGTGGSSSHDDNGVLLRREDTGTSTAEAAAGRALGEVEEYTGTCFQDCHDNETYQTWKGLSCSFHAELISSLAGDNCFHEWLDDTWFTKTYNQDEIFDLMYECPCACNVKCGLVYEGPTPPPTPEPEPSIGSIGVPAEELSGNESDVETLDIANRPEMDDETLPLSPSGSEGEEQNDALDILASATAPVSGQQESTSPDSTFFFFSGPLGLVAIIAGSAIGAAVLSLSVFSLFRNRAKKRHSGASTQVGHSDSGIRLSCSVSDMSYSVHSEEESSDSEADSSDSEAGSLDSEADRFYKYKRYKAWRRMQQRGGIDDGDDIIEP